MKKTNMLLKMNFAVFLIAGLLSRCHRSDQFPLS
jgi:hypothetical protein